MIFFEICNKRKYFNNKIFHSDFLEQRRFFDSAYKIGEIKPTDVNSSR